MEKKNLFISQATKILGGGSVISDRNFEAFSKIFSAGDTIRYKIGKPQKTIFLSLIDRCIKNYVNGINKNIISEISKIAEDCELIWIDNSTYGSIAKKLKKNNYKGKIIVFFHNIEYIFQKRPFVKRLLYPIFNLPIKNAEKNAAKYADLIFVLTERDRNEVQNWKNKTPIVLLPSSLKDTYRNYPEKKSNCLKKEVLFVGSNFYANVNGIMWFINNVLPYVDIHLTIVGSRMNELPITSNEKIEIHGFVEDLYTFYAKADCVIAPIFEGSGMKTKTTEALMWGKFIIGTKEAFCGFDITDDIGVCCENSEDFINAIRTMENRTSTFNLASRKLFLEKYSNNKSVEIIQEAIKNYLYKNK